MLDHVGHPLARDAADPFGATRLAWRADDSTAGPTYRFTGKEDDPLSGAIAVGARHYLPELGRWASPDPYHLLNPAARLEEPGERNLYRYAANNPIGKVDPTGHGWVTWIIKAGKATFKAAYKGYDKVDEFSGIADDVLTIASAEAGIGARVLSALSLASEALPVSAGDIKGAYRWVRGGDKALDSAAAARKHPIGTYRELSDAKARDAHHIIQDAAARDLPGYKYGDAPAIRLEGPARTPGTEHHAATQAQRQRGGGTYAAERRIGYKAMREAGIPPNLARRAIEVADRYFGSLGVTPSTPTRIPGNRK
ncbi:RHS repeat-associated core domain-containing protein [Nannocystis punicea]|uniref:Tox-SHH domain-containing protein n=1 Tax=Nannocystis punicea TaxID=2995304 RepID=A0ABY7HAT2_9BACT|nr:RHS repeat-associated core domain-containing protein [Nannocystis poenicansa]WAS96381.1 hypothetical protein O0S08_09495 [Nannocystis poenicansa]